MKNIRVFVSEIFQILEVKFSIYLNRHVFVMSLRWAHLSEGTFWDVSAHMVIVTRLITINY